MENVELKLLQSLIALVEESSVTKAAIRLQLSQPRMSNALRRLRKLFDDPLLVRSGQHMVPTTAAIEIANRVRMGLEEIGSALSNGRRFDPLTSQRSFIAMMSDYVAVLIFPEFLRRIRSVAPGIEVRLHQIGHDRIQNHLEEGACDIAVGAFGRLDQNLRIVRCFQDGVACVVSATHPVIQGSLSLETFLASQHILLANLSNSFSTADIMCDRQLHLMGNARTVSARAPSAYTLARIVASTDLIGVLPERLVRDYAQHLPLQCLPVPLDLDELSTSVVWHERSQRDPGHRWLREQFRQVALDLAPHPEISGQT